MSRRGLIPRRWRSRSHPHSKASTADLTTDTEQIGLQHLEDEDPAGPPPNPTTADAAIGEPFIVCQIGKIYKIEDLGLRSAGLGSGDQAGLMAITPGSSGENHPQCTERP